MSWANDCRDRYGPVVPVFQPIVDLRTDEVVAHEALARWPMHLGTTSEDVFAMARRRGAIVELDEMCAEAAVVSAARARSRGGHALFVNIEADGIASGRSWSAIRRIRDLIDEHGSLIRPVAEFAERSLLENPANLLRAADVLRRAGAVIALDDVGADPASLVLLPLLTPEVIKLDRSLLDEDLDGERLSTLLAVLSYADRFDVVLVAEGIETE